LQLPSIKSHFQPPNMEIIATSAAEAEARINAEIAIWAKVIEATG
jgi:hypothetical protein